MVKVFDDYPVYTGDDLGVHYHPKKTLFKVWAPMASEVKLRLYKTGNGNDLICTISLDKITEGIWSTEVMKNIKNQYYTFQVMQDNFWLDESADMYAKAVGVNGKRGMVVNMDETDPFRWKTDKRPVVKNHTNIIIYESHIRDLTIAENSGIKNKGKFLGLTEKRRKGPGVVSTGLDHLKELGITHIHLLPCYDFDSIDESDPENKNYNWGYDPQNYNVPEGSYSTDPYDGRVRIKEFKKMVKALHSNGIGVIMDVVYNHTSTLKTPFNQFAPGYFYRQRHDGSYSDGSGCGNETASERQMMRKFMIDSVVYWAKEYHIDGFRFDLMGLHDIETMNMISDELHKIDPSIIIYGEGWTGGQTPLPEELRAVKKHTYMLNKIAAFSDDIRDGLRGSYSHAGEKGFVSGKYGNAETIKFGIVASTQHPQIDYEKVNYSHSPWAIEPYQTINYVSCHDDLTLFDKIIESNHGATEEQFINMDKLAQTVVLTSQGIPFIHSGAEMLRSKYGVHNSYKSPDNINEIDWSRKVKYKNVFDYYKGLISLRKNHPAFRMPSSEMIRTHLNFIDTHDPHFIAYMISGVHGEKWKEIIVLINGAHEARTFTLPAGTWMLAVDGKIINEKGIKQKSENVNVPSAMAFILYRA